MKFTSLGLSEPILKAIEEQGYAIPSAIQAQAIPAVLQGKDVMAAAQTGTGKTAGFTLPILELLAKGERAKANKARALILTPTRELAAQINASVCAYGKHIALNSSVVFGGVKINPQMMKLRKGVDILVATPGRLLDLYGQNAVKFDQLEILVLDEADRMLDMGFIHDIKKILKLLPKKRQTLMFSATFSDDIRHLAKGLVNNPVEISVTPRNSTVDSVKQWIIPVDKKQKAPLLIHLLKQNEWGQTLVFSRTKHGANKLVKQLAGAGLKAAAIHGNKSQAARTKALADFKDNKIAVLVATDIAARGIDINQLPQVINFDLPNIPEDYIHRIGRTGRAGATGQAVSLVSADEHKQLSDIERLIKRLLEREIVDDFDPVHALAESRLNTKPFKAKKSKQAKQGHRDGQRSGENSSGHNKGGGASAHKKPPSRPSKPSANGRQNNKQKKTASKAPRNSIYGKPQNSKPSAN